VPSPTAKTSIRSHCDRASSRTSSARSSVALSFWLPQRITASRTPSRASIVSAPSLALEAVDAFPPDERVAAGPADQAARRLPDTSAAAPSSATPSMVTRTPSADCT